MANCPIMKGGGGGVDCETANATAEVVSAGKTFGRNGKDDLDTGTMTYVDKGTSIPMGINGTYAIPKGEHPGTEVVKQSITTTGATTLTGSTTKVSLTKGRYMTGNVVIAGSKYLALGSDNKCPYILTGKSLWGRAGSLVNYEIGQVTY